MHAANQRPRKPDKLSQSAHKQTSYPRVQWETTLDKRETTDHRGNVRNVINLKELERQRGMQDQGTIGTIGLPMLQEARNKV